MQSLRPASRLMGLFSFLHRHPPKSLPSSLTTTQCALTKQGQRFLISIATTRDDSSAFDRTISKFVASSPKSVVLGTLSHLLSPHHHPHLSSLALPLYTRITKASWFSWNSKLVADVVALLYKQGQVEAADSLVSVTASSACPRERDLASFYCNLINSLTKLKSEHGFSDTFSLLREMLVSSHSSYVRKRAYESLVGGLCAMGAPHEAEILIDETRHLGLKPSLFEFRSLVEGYGKLGSFEKMEQCLVEMENSGFALDTITSNMVLSSYGLHNELSRMVVWLQKAKSLGIPFTIRTYNSAINSCPTVMSLSQDPKTAPISLEDLLAALGEDEALLLQELVGSSVLGERITWDPLESKLDLHGMHLGTSYLVVLQWMDELRRRFSSEQCKIPAEITLVCGSGKHSSVRGESVVKSLVREIMLRAGSPLRINRKNVGCFVAKGKTVKHWLC